MALSDDDKKEIGGLITKTLGLEEGKSFSDLIAKAAGDITNQVVNAYDKRTKGERDKELVELRKTLGLEEGKSLAEVLDARIKAAGGGDPLKTPDGKIDLSKLSEPVREMFAAQNSTLEKLTKDLEAQQKAREKEAAERQKIEGERAASAQLDAIRRAALDKDSLGGWTYDPEMADVLVTTVGNKVRKVDGKDAYEFQTGVDSISQTPIWKPLAEGLKEFGGTSLGKRFRPAQQGGGGGGGGGGGAGGGEKPLPFTVDQLTAMKPSEIEAAVKAGKFTSQ